MRTIMLLNAKGGCGKSTLSTNIASYYATKGKKVVLMDFDHQGSSMDWLSNRPAGKAEIIGISAWKGKVNTPRNADVVIMDIPAGAYGSQLTEFVRKAQTAIIPVLPSPMDMRAVAHFVTELKKQNKVGSKKIKLGLVANRVREHTRISQTLSEYLRGLKIPIVAHLRDSQNYIRAADRGLGVFELAPYQVAQDMEQWAPLVKWLNSKRSMP